MLNVLPRSDDYFSDILGCSVDVLDYSVLPTGTHKDIKALTAMVAAERADPDAKLIAISSGNYARALEKIANETRRSVVLVSSFSDKRSTTNSEYVEWIPINELADGNLLYGYALGLRYWNFCRKRNDSRFPINITNVSDINYLGNFSCRFIYDLPFLRANSYDVVLCPNGSGELISDLAEQCNSVCYGFSPMNHPCVMNSSMVLDPMVPTVADKLDCPTGFCQSYFYFNGRSTERIRYVGLSNDEILKSFERLKSLGYAVEPSSSVVGSVLFEDIRLRANIEFSVKSRVLVVLTGKGRNI